MKKLISTADGSARGLRPGPRINGHPLAFYPFGKPPQMPCTARTCVILAKGPVFEERLVIRYGATDQIVTAEHCWPACITASFPTSATGCW
jgi:hypothetical protein